MPTKKDRSAYWAAYHARRQKADPAYRERKAKARRRWYRLHKATLKGDVRTWLKHFQATD